MVAYCTKDDLLVGDIPLAAKYGDGTPFVQLAADEIDATIGHIYTTPVDFDSMAHPESRPSELLLKKINQLLASGRIVMDMAAGGEDQNLHAYGYSMWKEAWTLLQDIVNGKITLISAEKIARDETNPNTAVSIANEDGYSLVEAFYSGVPNYTGLYPHGSKRIKPYDDEQVVVP